MTKIFAVFAFAATAALAGSALADGFPKWPLNQTCQPGDSTCVRFEVFARGQISGTWNTLPPGARAICVTETEKVEKSYRLLQDCLASVMQTLLINQQRKPVSGDVVNLTPKAKEKTPPPAPAVPEPTPQVMPAKPLPVPQAGPVTSAAPENPAPVPQAGPAPMPAPTAAPEPAPRTMPANPAEPPKTPQ